MSTPFKNSRVFSGPDLVTSLLCNKIPMLKDILLQRWPEQILVGELT